MSSKIAEEVGAAPSRKTGASMPLGVEREWVMFDEDVPEHCVFCDQEIDELEGVLHDDGDKMVGYVVCPECEVVYGEY